MSRSRPPGQNRSVADAVGPLGIARHPKRSRRRADLGEDAAPLADVQLPAGTMSAGQVATTFGVTVRTLSNWEKAGILTPVRLGRNERRYFRITDVEQLINGRDE